VNKLPVVYFADQNCFEYLYMSLKSWERLDWSKYIDHFFIYNNRNSQFTEEQREKLSAINLPITTRLTTRGVEGIYNTRGRPMVLNERDAFIEISRQYRSGWLFKVDSDILIRDFRLLDYIDNFIKEENISVEDVCAIGAKVNEVRNCGPNLPNIQGGAYFLSMNQLCKGLFEDLDENDEVFLIKDLLHLDDHMITFKIYQKNGIIKWFAKEWVYTPNPSNCTPSLMHFNGSKENKDKMKIYYDKLCNMNKTPEYELYCLYHDEVTNIYKNQQDRITFVKMNRSEYIYHSKKHIYLKLQDWFREIGKEYAEYEFYYSLYKGYKEKMVDLPEYLGFIHYDMHFCGKEHKYKNITILDFIDNLISNNLLDTDTLVSFQPHDFWHIYNQNIILDYNEPDAFRLKDIKNNCIDIISDECSKFANRYMNLEELSTNQLDMSGSFLLHRDKFIQIMEFLSKVIEDGKLNIFDKTKRRQGEYMERYAAIYINFLNFKKINFPIFHNYTNSKIEFYPI